MKDPIQAYFVSSFPQVFLIFQYSGGLGMATKFLNVVATFTWSYTGKLKNILYPENFLNFKFSDLFVIIVSIGLASKFKQINEDLMAIKGLSVRPDFWAEYRIYYREVTNLIYFVDKAIAKIILISISNNLFFICVQLLRSLE